MVVPSSTRKKAKYSSPYLDKTLCLKFKANSNRKLTRTTAKVK